ncbi:MAG: 16S rRNA (uracil(1498)-N(3))-methyltransferase [Phycisphaerae bacterium]|nr:16S rRNA (uracil(1498)-N(3))-methyltransferase [Phycisphaerae bacterium]
MHRFYPDLAAPLVPGPLLISGDEAHHAVRVKRVAVGEAVQVLNGLGGVASARVTSIEKAGRSGWRLALAVDSVDRVEPIRPRVTVASAMPKGHRLADLIDGLAQVGAAAWRPLFTERGERQRCPVDRLERIAREASKQSGRAWTLRVEPEVGFDDALREPGTILADASGAAASVPMHAEAVLVLIGPEGGWTPREMDTALAAGVRVARFGPHTMRIETAAVAACAIVLDAAAR